MASERLQVILELVTGQYKREALGAAQATGKIGDSAGGVTSKIGAMLGPAAIGGAIIGLGNMAVKAGENADRLFDLAAQTGLSTDALQEWEFVAKTAGAGTEVFSDAVKAVIKNLNDTEGATGAAGKAYETLGVNVKDASGNLRDAGAITDEVFAKLAGMENITARNALAQDIFGKKWEETISILDLGTDAIQRAKDEAQGSIISEESLQGADKFRETWEKLKATLTAKLMQTLGNLGPVLSEIAEGLLEVVEEAEPLLEILGKAAGGFGDLREKGDEWADSNNGLAASVGRFVNDLSFLDILMANYGPHMAEAADASFELADQTKITGETTKDLKDQLDEAGQRAVFMADATKDDLNPALVALADMAYRAERGLIEAKLAAQAAGDAFRDDLAADYAAAAISIDKTSRAMGVSLDAIEARLLENLTDQAAFYTNLVALAEAGYGDLALFLRGQGADQVAGATADLVDDMERAADLENMIDQAELDAQSFADRLAGALEDERSRLVDVARSIGIDLGEGFKDGLSAVDLSNLLGIALGAPGLGPVQGGKTTTTTATGGSGAAGYGSGTRAFGGPIAAGQMYMVGERGPEMFVSGSSGSIIPNSALSRTVNINVASPTNNLAQDLQYATLLASVQTMVE